MRDSLSLLIFVRSFAFLLVLMSMSSGVVDCSLEGMTYMDCLDNDDCLYNPASNSYSYSPRTRYETNTNNQKYPSPSYSNSRQSQRQRQQNQQHKKKQHQASSLDELERSHTSHQFINSYRSALNNSAWFHTLQKSKRLSGGSNSAAYKAAQMSKAKLIAKNKKLLGSFDVTGKDCVDPDREYLETIFANFQAYYRKRADKVLKGKTMTASERIRFSSLLIENTQCNIEARPTSEINQASLCPWRYKTKMRYDKFPYTKKQVKCTCNECTTMGGQHLSVRGGVGSLNNRRNGGNDGMYGCLPVLQFEPVLKRDECGMDGFYSWVPTTEIVNLACVCAYRNIMIPIF